MMITNQCASPCVCVQARRKRFLATCTVHGTHSARRAQCTAHTVHSTHSAQHTGCTAHRVHGTHSAQHTQGARQPLKPPINTCVCFTPPVSSNLLCTLYTRPLLSETKIDPIATCVFVASLLLCHPLHKFGDSSLNQMIFNIICPSTSPQLTDQPLEIE